MSEPALLELADPGAGARLGATARSELADAVRGWRRAAPGAVLLEVPGDAWHHAPELAGSVLDREQVDVAYQALARSLFGLTCPVVVSLDGQVSGFGLALAMAADLRLATDRTTLTVGGPVAGLLGGVSWLVANVAGGGTFAQLAWTGATLSADEGIRRGLLSPAGDGRAIVRRLAEDATGSSALKRALNSPRQAGFGTVLDYQAWLADVAAGDPA